MIVGVTGFFAAGKDSFAEILVRRGFKHISLSDIIRAEIRRRGAEITIPRLTEVGNELRRDFGPQVLAERALEVLPAQGDAVVTSIRHGSEVQTLRSRRSFVMVFVDAPIQLRYERNVRRGRGGDPMTVEEFVAAEHTQMRSDDPDSQQLSVCKNMADFIILNDGSFQEFEEKTDQVLKQAAERLASDNQDKPAAST